MQRRQEEVAAICVPSTPESTADYTTPESSPSANDVEMAYKHSALCLDKELPDIPKLEFEHKEEVMDIMPYTTERTGPIKKPIVDTGAAGSVCPPEYAPKAESKPASANGPKFRSAHGEIAVPTANKMVTGLVQTAKGEK